MGTKSSLSLSFLSSSSLPRAEGAPLLQTPIPKSPVWPMCSTCHLKERERERKPPGNLTRPLIWLRTCLQQHVKQKHKQKKLWGLPLWGQTCWFHPASGTWKLCLWDSMSYLSVSQMPPPLNGAGRGAGGRWSNEGAQVRIRQGCLAHGNHSPGSYAALSTEGNAVWNCCPCWSPARYGPFSMHRRKIKPLLRIVSVSTQKS